MASVLLIVFATLSPAQWTDNPELRVSGAMRGVREGDPLIVVVTPERNGYDIELNRTVTRGIGFTAGAGWALLLGDQGSLRGPTNS